MENQVTLDRAEYDRLKEIEREAKTLKQIIDKDEPLIVNMVDGYNGVQEYNVYSGRDKVKALFNTLERRVVVAEDNSKAIEERYKKSQELLKYVKDNI